MKINDLLREMVRRESSDLHLKVGSPPIYRVNEELHTLDVKPLTAKDTEGLAMELLTERQREHFRQLSEVDCAYEEPDIGRFRVNIHYQRTTVGIAIRWVRSKILTDEELGLPPVFRQIAMFSRGFVLVTGATSSGKSTTQAAMVDYMNRHRNCHIITIEDPIEFLHHDKLAAITQREVGIDTESFVTAMRHAVRQDPDVILIGEMRDAETFNVALSASETGHLVISTLHTTDVMQSIDRLMDFFHPSQHEQVRALLALNLQAVTCQRLVRRADGMGLVPAVEVMIVTPAVRSIIRENRVTKIPSAISAGAEDGMQTFNQALVLLVHDGKITEEEALANSGNPEALRMNLKGIYLDEDRGILGM